MHSKQESNRTSLRAAIATPCAWFPAEAHITPFCICSSVICDMRLKAPRTLKECTGCRSSRFSRMVLPNSSLKRFASSRGVSSCDQMQKRRFGMLLDGDSLHCKAEWCCLAPHSSAWPPQEGFLPASRCTERDLYQPFRSASA